MEAAHDPLIWVSFMALPSIAPRRLTSDILLWIRKESGPIGPGFAQAP